MTVAVVAEKPSVARDIARVLGAEAGRGLLTGNGYVVTWAIGHLVAPGRAARDPARVEALGGRGPARCCPTEWPLVVAGRPRASSSVKKVLRDPEVSEVVCATDAGREGELIFRYIYEAAGCRKPVSRLWISSLTPEAIRAGLRRAPRRHASSIPWPTPPAAAAGPTGSWA